MPEHTIELITSDARTLTLTCPDDEDIISAALHSDIYLNAQCRSGSCGACLARCTDGQYSHSEQGAAALPAAEREGGQILLCCTSPRSDLKIQLPYPYDLIRFEALPVRTAVIHAKTYLTPDTVRLDLQLQPDADGMASLAFEPGQFIDVGIPGSDIKRPYSIANAPNWDGSLELLIRLRPHGRFSTWLHEVAQPGMELTVEGGLGTFVLRDHGLRPRWFVAGGCGLASAMSMLRRMAEWQEPHPVRLFFGVWSEAELFYQDELAQLSAEYPNLSVAICVAQPTEQWSGCRGSVVDTLEQAFGEASSIPDIYICGSAGLVTTVRELARTRGIPDDHLIYESYLPGADSGTTSCAIT